MTLTIVRKHVAQEYQKLEDLVRETRLEQAHEGAQNVAIGCAFILSSAPISGSFLAWPLLAVGAFIGACNLNQLGNLIDYKVRPEVLQPDISVEITDDFLSLKSGPYTFLRADSRKYQENQKEYLTEELSALHDCVDYFTQTAQHIDNMKKTAQRMQVMLKDHPTVRKIVAAPRYWIHGTTMHSSLQKRLEAAQEMNCRLGLTEAVFEYGAQFYQTLTSNESDTRRSLDECYQLCRQGAQIVKTQKIVEQDVLATLQKAFDYVYPHPEISRWLPF